MPAEENDRPLCPGCDGIPGGHTHRLGVLPYLVARPLLTGLDDSPAIEVVRARPADMPSLACGDAVEVALMEVLEIQRFGRPLSVLPAGCLAFEASAMSLRLFSRVPPDEIQVVWADDSSRTVAALAQVLWQAIFKQTLRLVPFYAYRGDPPADAQAALIVGDRAVVATGSDLTLLRKVIRRLKAGEAPEPSPALRRLQTHVSPDQNIYIATSLPVYLGASLARGGTPTDQIGTVDPGHERVGVGIRFRGTTAQLTTYWPHEQIRMARDLIGRVAPEVEKVPESLFPPEPEGPPEIEAPPEGEGEAEPEGGAAPAPAP